MPPVVALIIGIGLAGAGGATLAVTSGVLFAGITAAEFAITLISAGASLILSGVEGMIHKPGSPTGTLTQTGNSVTLKQAAANRVIVYGRMMVGGVITYIATTGAMNEFMHLVVTFTGHQVDAVEAILFDQYTLVLSGGSSGNETSQYAGGFLSVETKLGAPGEAAFPGLISDTSGLGAAAWTSSCRQDGCCSIHFKLKWDQTKWPNGVPNIRAKIRGKLVFDPRSSTTAWSNNLALCVRDYLTDSVNGMKASAADIEPTSMTAAANLADELVALLAGGNENRYTCNGVFDTSKTKGTVLQGLLTAGVGKLGWIAGQWNLFLGAWRAPTLSYSDDDFRAGLQLTSRISRRDLYTGVKGTFIDPTNDWQQNTFPSVVRAAYVADDSGITGTTDFGFWATATVYPLLAAVMSNGFAYVCTSAHTSGASTQPGVGASWPTVWELAPELNWKTVDYPFTTSVSTAQRLSKIDLEIGRRQISAAAPLKLGGYLAQPPDVIEVTHPNFGWTNKTFEVTQCDLSQQQDGALGADLTLAETDANVYAWSVAFEQAQGGVITPSVSDPHNPVAPTSLGLTSGAGTVLTRGDGIKLSRIEVTWLAPADQFVLSGGKIFVEYALHGSGSWQPADEVDGATTITFIQGVSDGTAYDVRIRSRNVFDVYSAWVELDNHTVSSTISTFTGVLTNAGQNFADNPLFEIGPSPGSGDIAAGYFTQNNTLPAMMSVSLETLASGSIFVYSGINVLYFSVNPNVSVPPTAGGGTSGEFAVVKSRGEFPVQPGQVWRVRVKCRVDSNIGTPAGLVPSAFAFARILFSDGTTQDFQTNTINSPNSAFADLVVTLTVPTPTGKTVVSLSVWFCNSVGNTTGSAINTPNGLMFDARFDNVEVIRLTVDGEAIFNASTVLNGQGSIPPTGPIVFTLTTNSNASGSCTQTWSWPTTTLTRADGSTFSVTGSSASWTGLAAATTYYYYPKIRLSDMTIHWGASKDPNTTPATAPNVADAIAQNSDGFIDAAGQINATTPATSGGSGSGGGGNPLCVEEHEPATVKSELAGEARDAEMGQIVAGNYIRGLDLATGEEVYRRVLYTAREYCSHWYRVDGHLFTPLEEVWRDGQYRFACTLADAEQVLQPGWKIKIAVEAARDEDKNFYVGRTLVHNVRLTS